MAVLQEWPYSEAGRVTEFGQFWLGQVWGWSWGLLAHDLFGVVTAVLTAAVVVAIYQMQERKRAEVGSPEAQPRTAIAATRQCP